VSRVAGCLLGLLLVPLAVAAAGAGYLFRARAGDGRWLAALAWCATALVLGAAVLAVTGLARRLLGGDRGDPPPS
jgi:hypothetical protein